ncbi:MAG: hypothetical protein M3O70_21255 [Actinomycetota bacterium]|nr:hypothetical protein [Actinomycetota bacterium]
MADEYIRDEDGEEPPFIDEDWSGRGGPVSYDEGGLFGLPMVGSAPDWPWGPETDLPRERMAAARWGAHVPLPMACSLTTLNGSWYLRFPRVWPFPFQGLRGVLRIEANPTQLRVSGDIYRKRPPTTGSPFAVPEEEIALPAEALLIQRNWYPQFPQDEYAWYLRSTGVTYSGGVLNVPFERHLWSSSQQAFTATDTGWLRLTCHHHVLRKALFPRPTVRITGHVLVGGKAYPVEAVKTSPYYRGCHVEVDVMANRNWPTTASHGGGTVSFTGVYRAHGLDFQAVVSQTDIPEQASLTVANLHTLLTTHREAAGAPGVWRLWLFVGSRLGTGNTYGLMFDQDAPHREGAVGFGDATLPDENYVEASARGQTLNAVPSAFLRTLVHEAGHAFNLYHPKHDVHAPPIGRTIMNQTGDVMGFASSSDPYPGNAQFAFNDHNAPSLVHSPDPQVAPGWRDFGWGHGSLWGGAAEPTDVGGLADTVSTDTGLHLELRLPARTVRGEILVAGVTVTNLDEVPRAVTAGLNLAEGDLRMVVEQPSGDTVELRDVVLLCGPRRMIEVQPGDLISGALQLFYTNQGFAFDQPGLYRVTAVLDVGDGSGQTLHSEPQELEVGLPVDQQERDLAELSIDQDVGLAVAFGDTGGNEAVEERLRACMDEFSDRDSGAVAALVLANSFSRPVIDIAQGTVEREPDSSQAQSALDQAMEGRAVGDVARLAVATASPAEPDAPVLDALLDRIRQAPGTYDEEEITHAEHLLDTVRAD